jgi:hypothetical protein
LGKRRLGFNVSRTVGEDGVAGVVGLDGVAGKDDVAGLDGVVAGSDGISR